MNAGRLRELWQRVCEADYKVFAMVSASTAAFAWGFLLILPMHTFASTAAYRAMLLTWPHSEEAWGVVCMGLGLFQSFAVAARWKQGRLWALSAAVMLWSFIAAMFWIGNPAGIGWSTYTLFAVFSLLARHSLLGQLWTGK